MTRRVRAIEFAKLLAEKVSSSSWLNAIKGSEGQANEHKLLAERIQDQLAKFIRESSLDSSKVRFDFEGNSERTWKQSHSYELLGTFAHPDAAVLEPFTCALEFDRHAPTRGPSYFKERLMKAACHVLSGAYDAALFVYLTSGSEYTRETYLDSNAKFSQRLISSLEQQGLVVAIV